MKKTFLLLIAVASLPFYVIGQKSVDYQLMISFELASDFGRMSVFDDYGIMSGNGISFVGRNNQSFSWYIKYSSSVAHAQNKPAAIVINETKFPDYDLFSKSQINSNSLSFGSKWTFIDTNKYQGFIHGSVGYNNICRSGVWAYRPSDQLKLLIEEPAFYHGMKSCVFIGGSFPISENMRFIIEFGYELLLQHYYSNTFIDASGFACIQLGINVDI